MAKNGTVVGLNIDSTDDFFCGGCAMGKMARKPYKTAAAKTVGVGERIHSDVCGPMEVPSLSKARYAIHFKDEASGYKRVYFMASKDQAIDKLKEFVAEQRAEQDAVAIAVHADDVGMGEGGLAAVHADREGAGRIALDAAR